MGECAIGVRYRGECGSDGIVEREEGGWDMARDGESARRKHWTINRLRVEGYLQDGFMTQRTIIYLSSLRL